MTADAMRRGARLGPLTHDLCTALRRAALHCTAWPAAALDGGIGLRPWAMGCRNCAVENGSLESALTAEDSDGFSGGPARRHLLRLTPLSRRNVEKGDGRHIVQDVMVRTFFFEIAIPICIGYVAPPTRTVTLTATPVIAKPCASS